MVAKVSLAEPFGVVLVINPEALHAQWQEVGRLTRVSLTWGGLGFLHKHTTQTLHTRFFSFVDF